MASEDPVMRVQCDQCGAVGHVEMEVRYGNYSGTDMFFRDPFQYDDDKGVESQEGIRFFCTDDDNDQHECEDCYEDEEDDDDDSE